MEQPPFGEQIKTLRDRLETLRQGISNQPEAARGELDQVLQELTGIITGLENTGQTLDVRANRRLAALADLARIPDENPGPVLRLAEDGKILYANPAALAMIDPLAGETGQSADRAWLQKLRQAIRSAENQRVDVHIGERLFSFLIVPVTDREYFNLYGRDVTDRRQAEALAEQMAVEAEAAIQEAECQAAENRRQQALLDAIFEADPGGLAVVTGEELRFVYVNPAYHYLTPDPVLDPIGQPYNRVWPHGSRYGHRERFHQVLGTGQPYQTTGVEHTFPDGCTRIFTIQARRIDWDNQPAVLLAYWDVTELKQAEKLLAEQSELFETVQDAIIATDAKLTITSWNQAAEQLYGWSRAEAVGQNASRLLRSELSNSQRRTALQQAQQAGMIESETIHHARDGRRLVIETHTKVRIGPGGKVIGYISSNRDVSTRRRAEGFSRALNEVHQILLSTHAVEEVLQGAVSAGAQAIGCETAALSLRQENHWRVGYVYGFPQDVVGTYMDDQEERHAVLAILTCQPVAIDDAFHDERVNQQHMREWGVRSVLVVPVLLKEQVIGVIFFNFHQKVFEFGEEHLDFGVKLAASISLALENARLFHELEKEVAERELAARSVALEKEWFHTSLSSIGDAVITTDSQGIVTFLNPVAASLTGWSSAEAVGLPLEQVFPIVNEQTHLSVQNPVERVLSEGRIVGLGNHTALIHRDGRTIPIEDSAAPIRNESGETLGVVMVFHDVSQKRQAEQALGQSEEKFARAFHSNPAAMTITRAADAQYIDVNQSYCELTGYSREEFLGHTSVELGLYSEADRTEVMRKFREQGLVRLQEFTVTTQKGDQRWVLFSLDPIEVGGEACNLATLIDITERKQAEESLRENQMLLRAVMDTTQDPVYVKDRQSRILLANQGLANLVGKPIEEIIGKTDSEYYDNADIGHTLRENDLKVMESEESLSVEETVRTREGWRTFLSAKDPYRNPQGQVIGIIGISRDITERKQDEETTKQFTRQLQETQKYLENLFNYANAPIIVWDPDHKITRFNHAFEHLASYSAEEVLGKSLDLLFDAATREESLAKISLTTSGEYWESVEIPIRRKDGEIRIALWNSANIYADDGKTLQATIAQGQDITESKKAEAEAQSRRVQVELQRQLLEQREQERQQIARDLHDGPVQELTGAHYALEEILYTSQDEALIQGLQAVRDTIKGQVAELRAYAGELRPPALPKFGLGKAIRSHLDTFQEKHPDLELRFEEEQGGDLLSQEVRLALFRIYQEALTNISKHAQANQVIIRLEKTSAEAILEISDNGNGFTVPQDWLEMALQKHLGLVGMRERAEAVGGRMEIDTKPGKGTRVVVTVPLVIPENGHSQG